MLVKMVVDVLLNLPSELDIIVLRPSDHVFDCLTVIHVQRVSSGPQRSYSDLARISKETPPRLSIYQYMR
jgi:hypothetical protein